MIELPFNHEVNVMDEHAHRWSPIRPLTDEDRAEDLSELEALRAAWEATQEELKESSSAQLAAFHERLIRSWSIETGIIEHLYDLDVGTTKTLIEHGFRVDLINRSSTNINPVDLIEILNDHRAAAEVVMNGVTGQRGLTRGLLFELHAILTRHQETLEAVDSQGNRVLVPLLRGAFKQMPNNPTRPDGRVHEYCPPVHVDSEIDNLLQWFNEYEQEHSCLMAAWLHHRFTQIHPFQDGNGRVARCLVTLVLLRGHYLPIVVSRNDARYLKALEAADGGRLSDLVALFADLEREILLGALSIARDVTEEPRLVEQVATDIAARLKQRHERQREQWRSVNQLAEALLEAGKLVVDENLCRAVQLLNGQQEVEFQLIPDKESDEGGPHVSAREHWFRFQIVSTAQVTSHWANLNEAHYWFKRSVHSSSSRLTFVVSFHHVGHELTGVMAATSFAELSYEQEEAIEQNRENREREFMPCMLRHFAFTWQNTLAEVKPRFHEWLNECLAIALRKWGDTL